ncbi:MAG: MAC/perforin domain-containing protein, partial [Gemmatimonadales bacterium]
SHTITLSELEAFCSLEGQNPRSVMLTSEEPVVIQFDVTCGNPAPDFDLAGMEVLGSGYNVTGNYADVADVKAVVLDLDALQASNLLRQVQYERATYHVVSGEDSHEYQRSLSTKVKITGSAFGFSGALKASFKQDRYESRHYSFATVQSVIRKHGLRVALSVQPEELRGYLAPAAAAAINDPSVDPEYLFETFGTHVLTGIIVGGRLDFSTSANMSFERQDRSIDVYARASFKNVFASASIEAEATDDLSWSEYSATEEKHLEVYGGRSEYGQYIMNEGVYESWIESIEENSVFMDFESTGLLGIWELADDAGRRGELAAAWNTYAEAHGITLLAAGTVVSNFAEDQEDWLYYDASGNPQTPEHHLQGGYFGGYIVGSESGGDFLDFSAPNSFLGDKTMYAGGTLQYYLFYSPDPHDIFNPPSWHASIRYFVVVLSENGNLIYKPANSDNVPDPRFRPGNYNHSDPTLFVVNLKAGEQTGEDGSVPGMWYRWDRQPAEEVDIWMSLASVRAIKIMADFLDIEERVALDKVLLTAPLDNP